MAHRLRDPRSFRVIPLAVAGLLLVVAARPAAAQTGPGGRGPSVALIAGASEYDLSGTGTTWFVAMRWESNVRSFLAVGPAIQYFQYNGPVGERIRYLVPEAQVFLRLPAGRVQPYLSAGAGAAWLSRVVNDELDISLSAGVGVRVEMRDLGWLLEGRLRSIDPWAGSTADLGLGFFRR